MSRVLTAVVLGSVLCTGAAVGDEAEKKALKDLEGTYSLKSITMGNEGPPEEVIKSFKEMVIKDSTFTTKWSDREESATIELDPAKKPGHIDMSPTTGEEVGVTLKGIYKFEKDTLTISFTGDGQELPKDFKSKDDTTQVVLVFQKKPKK